MGINKDKYLAFCVDLWSECNKKHKSIRVSRLVRLHKVSYEYFIFLIDNNIISKTGIGKGAKFKWIDEKPNDEFIEISIDIWKNDNGDGAKQFCKAKMVNTISIVNMYHYLSIINVRENDYYYGAYSILSDLEEYVAYEDPPPKDVLVYRKPGGVCHFKLENVSGNLCYYEFIGIAS